MTDRKREGEPLDEEIKGIMDYLQTLDNDAQTAAILDIEKAISGSPTIARPQWLRGASPEVLLGTRQRLMEAFSARVTTSAKADAKTDTDTHN